MATSRPGGESDGGGRDGRRPRAGLTTRALRDIREALRVATSEGASSVELHGVRCTCRTSAARLQTVEPAGTHAGPRPATAAPTASERASEPRARTRREERSLERKQRYLAARAGACSAPTTDLEADGLGSGRTAEEGPEADLQRLGDATGAEPPPPPAPPSLPTCSEAEPQQPMEMETGSRSKRDAPSPAELQLDTAAPATAEATFAAPSCHATLGRQVAAPQPTAPGSKSPRDGSTSRSPNRPGTPRAPHDSPPPRGAPKRPKVLSPKAHAWVHRVAGMQARDAVGLLDYDTEKEIRRLLWQHDLPRGEVTDMVDNFLCSMAHGELTEDDL